MAKQMDFQPTKEAVSKLVKVPGAAQQARETVIEAPRGPFTVNIVAGYDRSLFVNNKTVEYEFDVDFRDSRLLLNEFLIGAGRNLDVFLSDYQPVGDMMKATVPTVRQQFDAALAELVTVTSVAAGMQAMGAGLSMNFAQQVMLLARLGTRQLGGLIEKLEQLTAHLQTGLKQVDAGTQGVAKFREQQDGYQSNLAKVKEAFQQSASDSLKQVQELLNKQPAGQAEAKQHFQYLQSIFSTTVGKVDEILTTDVANDVDGANHSLNVIHGTVEELASKNESLVDELKGKKRTRASETVIENETLNLGDATGGWQDLADHTAKELKQNP